MILPDFYGKFKKTTNKKFWTWFAENFHYMSKKVDAKSKKPSWFSFENFELFKHVIIVFLLNFICLQNEAKSEFQEKGFDKPLKMYLSFISTMNRKVILKIEIGDSFLQSLSNPFWRNFKTRFFVIASVKIKKIKKCFD